MQTTSGLDIVSLPYRPGRVTPDAVLDMTFQPTVQVKGQGILHNMRWQVQDAHGCAAWEPQQFNVGKAVGKTGKAGCMGARPTRSKGTSCTRHVKALLSINCFRFLCWRRLKPPSQNKVVLCCAMLPAARRARHHQAWQQCSRLLGSWATVDPKGMSGSSPAQCYNLGEGPGLQAKVLHKHACQAVSDACLCAPNRGQECTCSRIQSAACTCLLLPKSLRLMLQSMADGTCLPTARPFPTLTMESHLSRSQTHRWDFLQSLF